MNRFLHVTCKRIYAFALAMLMVLSSVISDGMVTTKAETTASAQIHNFTTDDIVSSFYTISGSTSTGKGTVSYDGLTLTKCLKVSSKASVSFTSAGDGTLTLVFNPSCVGYSIYFNGTSYEIPADGILKFDVTAGSYEITKNKSESFLYYVSLVYGAAEESTEATEESTEVTEESTEATEATEESSEESGESTGKNLILNVSTDMTASDITANTEVNGFTILATSGKKVVVDANKKSLNGVDYTQRIKLGGTGDVEYRSVKFTTTGSAVVKVVALSSSSSSARDLALATVSDGAFTNIATQSIAGTPIDEYSYTVNEAGTYYLYSTSGGINLYYIEVVHSDVSTEESTEATEETTEATEESTEATEESTEATEESSEPNVDESDLTVTNVGGWNEILYIQMSGIKDADVTAVSYSGPTSGTLSGEDFEYLVREVDNTVRIDIPGLKAGTYSISVTTSKGTVEESGIVVEEQDRSGYAHFNYTAGVGAYNDDGTLKDNAIVLYVTDENKDTVSVTSKDGTTVTGIGNILNSVGQDVGGGVNAKGGIPNTNADIIRKLADDGTPLVVRIIGNVTAPAGVTAYDSIDYGGSKGDNGYMVRMKSGKDITIEGMGYDAVINGWGIHFMAESAYPEYGKSFEVRNISFQNVPEDCVGMEGVQSDDNTTLTAPVERCWVHNCEFIGPTISNPAESDKDGGDGACDFKRGQYFTNSYCYYNGYHKTNLVGASDNNLQYNITYHHNYWQNCESRGPLARTANIHMYNNIFENQSSYAMNPRANTYIFSEYNMFYLVKAPMQVKSGAIKSYNDSFSGCIKEMDGVIVTDKNTQVPSNNKYANFDTNSSLSYIPSGDYRLQESVTEAKKVIYALTGPMDENVVAVKDVTIEDISLLTDSQRPSTAVVLPYEQNLNNTYLTSTSATIDNINFNVAKLASDTITIGGKAGGQNIVFRVDTPVNIEMTDGGASNKIVLLNEAGEEIITGTGKATNVPAGVYIIQTFEFQPAETVEAVSFKEAKITYLSIEAYDPNAPVDPEPSEPSSESGEASSDSSAESSESSQPPVSGSALIHNFTTDDKNSSFYTIAGDLSSSKGTVTYNELTLTQCLKVSSKAKVAFASAGDGTLTLVFNPSCAGYTIYFNGTSYAIPADGILTFDVEAGNYEITKNKSESFLYYVALEYDAAEESSEATEESTEQTEESTEATEESTEATEESGEPGEESHKHSADEDDWNYNYSHHWHNCEGCDELINFTAHNWSDWKDIGNNEMRRKCADCGAEQTREIPVTGIPATGTSTQTSDNSNLVLWMMLFVLCGGALAGMKVHSKKK